ncbi:hypothetical protein D3C84_1039770 [compost metagenome]
MHLRQQHITAQLPGCRALGAEVIADKALTARWRLADGRELRIDLNLAASAVPCKLPEASTHLYFCTDAPLGRNQLGAYSALVSLLPPLTPEPAHD